MKSKAGTDTEFFRTEKIPKILLQIAPPVMLAQLIQAMYNIVDSFFVGKYSESALTALSVIYPLQLIIIALAVGTGVGVNTYMARLYAQKMPGQAEETAGTGTLLALGTWFIFAIFSIFCMRPYVLTSANTPEAIESAVIYGQIVCIGSIGAFLEGNWTKVHQSRGNMHRPMVAQTVGALTNIVLDPILIFGLGPVPELGVAGAAYATVCGQVAAAVITSFGGVGRLPERTKMPLYIKQIYWFGYASIIMQALFTVYIVILNAILAGFSDSAVTVLGLYYKMQTFFFIPLMGLQTCIVPVLSFNYATKSYARCREIMRDSYGFSCVFMLVGVICFVFFPVQLLQAFFKEQRGHRDRKKCIPYHRGKFYSGGIFTDDPGLLPGDRKWKSQSVPVCDAPDILSDPDFLGAVSSGTSVYLVCVSDLRGACWSDRDGSVLEDDQWMEE